MRIGILAPTTDYAVATHQLAKACEERGFESFWVPEHTHIPVSRRSPFPGGGELPKEYSHLRDPFVVLAAAAAVTNTIKLGTGISLVIEHDPIVQAKQVASLDQLSNGRFLFGIGAGWNEEEMRDHGTDPQTRWALLGERVRAMKESGPKSSLSFTANTSSSTRCGRGRSLCKSRIRRCTSAAPRRSGASAWRRATTAGCRSA